MADNEKKTQNDMVDKVKDLAKNKDDEKGKKDDASTLANLFKVFTIGLFLMGSPFTIGLFAVALAAVIGYKAYKAKTALNDKDIKNAAKSAEENSPDKSVDAKSLIDQLTKGKDGKELTAEEKLQKLMQFAMNFLNTKEGKDLVSNPMFKQVCNQSLGKDALENIEKMQKDPELKNNQEVDIQEKKDEKENSQETNSKEENSQEINNQNSKEENSQEIDEIKDDTPLNLNDDSFTPGGPEEKEEISVDESRDSITLEGNLDKEPGSINEVDDNEKLQQNQDSLKENNDYTPDDIEQVEIEDIEFKEFDQVSTPEEIKAEENNLSQSKEMNAPGFDINALDSFNK